MSNGPILCFGEIVWDAMPEGIFLGGAPLNVAYHLVQLGKPAFPVSRIGRDFLGEQTLRRLESAGVAKEQIQIDPDHHTGAVVIALDESGDASYDIREPAAWDFMEESDSLMQRAGEASALVYGTLSTRSAVNAGLLEALLREVPLSLCDVNLRKPYDDPENALKWASKATVIKLNEEELETLSPSSSKEVEEQAAALSERTGVKTIVVTMGGKGALAWADGSVVRMEAPRVEVADTVGAGDAFTACFLNEYLKHSEMKVALGKALKLGAFVAGQNGAQPHYDPDQVLGA